MSQPLVNSGTMGEQQENFRMMKKYMDRVVAGKEKASLMDLPNELLIELFKYLDVRSRFRMRLCKRLDWVQLTVSLQEAKNRCRKLKIDFSTDNVSISVEAGSSKTRRLIGIDIEQGLQMLAHNTYVQRIWLTIQPDLTEQQDRVFNTLLTFKACEMYIFQTDMMPLCNLPQLTGAHLRNISQNVEILSLNIICNTVTANDLCILRKEMLRGSCKVREFVIFVESKTVLNFVECCFGISIEEEILPLGRRAMIYRSNYDAEIYAYNHAHIDFYHMENDYCTRCHTFGQGGQIMIMKKTRMAPPANCTRIMMNHLYEID